MDKETQSRILEFLLTYGWAIIVVFVALGALIFFGLLPTETLTGSSCMISPDIGCLDHSISKDGNITLVLRNDFDKDLTNVNLEVGNCTKTFGTWKAGEILGGNFTEFINCSSRTAFYREDITLTYNCNGCTATGQLKGFVG